MGAADALGSLGDDRAVAALASALSEDFAEVRREAALSLGRMRNGAATRALLSAVREDADPGVRWRAAMVLGQVGDSTILNILRRAMRRERESSVRESLRRAVDELQPRA